MRYAVDGIVYRVKLRSWVPVVLMTGRDCVTIGHTIYCRRASMHRRTHAHEYAHVLQYERYGVFGFLRRYLVALVRHGYDKHPLELEAHAYAHDNESRFEHVMRRGR